MSNKQTEQILADIIRYEMGLAQDQIWIRQQNVLIPSDKRLYCVVGYIDGSVISSQSYLESSGGVPSGGDFDANDFNNNDFNVGTGGGGGNGDFNADDFNSDDFDTGGGIGPVIEYEITRVNMRENIQVDLYGSQNDVNQRRWEVVAALRSIYSQQQQEAAFIRIFPKPTTFVNSSSAEGGSQLNRYTLIIPTFVWYKKKRILTVDGKQYFDDYVARVDDEKTIGQPDPLFQIEQTEGI